MTADISCQSRDTLIHRSFLLLTYMFIHGFMLTTLKMKVKTTRNQQQQEQGDSWVWGIFVKVSNIYSTQAVV